MNDRERARIEMLKRVGVFTGKYVDDWSGKSKQWAEELTTADTGIIPKIDKLTAKQAGSSSDFHGGATLKSVLRDALYLELRGLNRTAAAIAEATKQPQIMDSFRMPYGVSDQLLAARARAIADAAGPMTAEFQEYGHAATFVADLRSHIKAFEDADDDKESGLGDQVGATAGLGPLIKTGLTRVKQLDAFVNNTYKSDAEKLGEWKTASHVERQPKTKPAPTPPTP